MIYYFPEGNLFYLAHCTLYSPLTVYAREPFWGDCFTTCPSWFMFTSLRRFISFLERFVGAPPLL